MTEATGCVVCASPSLSVIESQLSQGTGKKKVAAEFGVTEWALRIHSGHAPATATTPKIEISEESDGLISLAGTFDDTVSRSEDFLRLFDLDPTQFEIVGDTAMSLTATGKYTYRFKARRVSLGYDASEKIATWSQALLANNDLPVRPALLGEKNSYVICVADPQIGKKGTNEAVNNWVVGVKGHLARARFLSSIGEIDRLVVAFMGDEHEGVSGNYTNQPHTVELNLSAQLELDMELRLWTLRQAAELQMPVQVVSVISNHGTSWVRAGGRDPITSQGDNSSTMVARMAKQAFDLAGGYSNLSWSIAEGGTPGVIVDVSGVKTYFSHGYIEKGGGARPEIRQANAMKNQILADPKKMGDIDIFMLAHYHHQWTQQDRGFTVMGCPALEAERSSEYMLDQYGVWSKPGMLGLTIGTKSGPLGWANLSVF